MTNRDELTQLLKAKIEIRAQIRKRAHDQLHELDCEIGDLERELEKERNYVNERTM